MLILNKYQVTKNGEMVMPISISGSTIQCVNMQGEIVFKREEDFLEESIKKIKDQKIVEVSPVESLNDDFLFDKKNKKLYDNELFNEKEIEELNKKPVKKIERREERKKFTSSEKYI